MSDNEIMETSEKSPEVSLEKPKPKAKAKKTKVLEKKPLKKEVQIEKNSTEKEDPCPECKYKYGHVFCQTCVKEI